MTNLNHPTAADFRNAETVEKFDALCAQANEYFAFVEWPELAEREGLDVEADYDDGIAHDALDAFLNRVGVTRPRREH